MSSTVYVGAHVRTVEQVCISMLPTGDYLCSPFTIWLLKDGGALRVFEPIDVSVQCMRVYPDLWQGARWGGGASQGNMGEGKRSEERWGNEEHVTYNSSPTPHHRALNLYEVATLFARFLQRLWPYSHCSVVTAFHLCAFWTQQKLRFLQDTPGNWTSLELKKKNKKTLNIFHKYLIYCLRKKNYSMKSKDVKNNPDDGCLSFRLPLLSVLAHCHILPGLTGALE